MASAAVDLKQDGTVSSSRFTCSDTYPLLLLTLGHRRALADAQWLRSAQPEAHTSVPSQLNLKKFR